MPVAFETHDRSRLHELRPLDDVCTTAIAALGLVGAIAVLIPYLH
jgi:hypothetical protein